MQIKLETFKERCEIHFHAVVEGEEWKDAQQKATIDLARNGERTPPPPNTASFI